MQFKARKVNMFVGRLQKNMKSLCETVSVL